MSNKEKIEQLIGKFGEEYRTLIEDAIPWLDKRLPEWDLDEPIDKEEFVADLVSRCSPRECK